MLKNAIVCLAAVTLTTMSAVPTSAAPKHPGRAERIYLALGDSLAFGTGASSPQHGYVGILGSFFQMPPHGNVDATINLSIPGETAGSFISNGQLAQALAVINSPANDVPVLTLDIGGNDLLGLLESPPCSVSPSGDACTMLIRTALYG